MYYLFSPLMKDGKQVVRIPEYGDIFVDGDEEILVSKRTDRWTLSKPILTMKKFEEDPFKEIREAHKHITESELSVYDCWDAAWNAIVKTMERLGGK